MMNFLKAILIVMVGLFVLVLVAALLVDPNQKTPPKAKAPEKQVCDPKQAAQLVSEMIHQAHVFKHIKTESAIPKVTVEPVWYTLDFDEKKAVDNGILCWLADGYPSKVTNVKYLDSFTGKTVASSGPFGFSMD